jgi:phage-related holin
MIDIIYHYLCGHFNFICTKLLLALIPAGVFIITDMHREVLAIVLWLLIIDTFLGFAVALKYKQVRSNRMVRALHKFLLYMSALGTAYLVSCLDIPIVEYFYLYIGAFISITEATSNFEKLSLLGFKMPQKLLSKLNEDFLDIDKMKNKWIEK